jgi:hypothetical protein
MQQHYQLQLHYASVSWLQVDLHKELTERPLAMHLHQTQHSICDEIQVSNMAAVVPASSLRPCFC